MLLSLFERAFIDRFFLQCRRPRPDKS